MTDERLNRAKALPEEQPGLVSRAWRIEKILHYLQTGYGKNPCKGFGG